VDRVGDRARAAGFFGDAVVTNLFGASSRAAPRRPFYYYLYQFPAETLPWFLLAPVVWWAARSGVFVANGSDEDRRVWRFLLAWIAATLVFFTLSTGKRGLYLVPLLPAVALLLADALGRWVDAAHRIQIAFHAATGVIGAARSAAACGLRFAIRCTTRPRRSCQAQRSR
jgi:4-amino-4-deoxy-L-arabinose transferase-like glycosyltransferase